MRTEQMLHKTQFDNHKNVSSTQIGSFTVLNIIWEGKKKKKRRILTEPQNLLHLL